MFQTSINMNNKETLMKPPFFKHANIPKTSLDYPPLKNPTFKNQNLEMRLDENDDNYDDQNLSPSFNNGCHMQKFLFSLSPFSIRALLPHVTCLLFLFLNGLLSSRICTNHRERKEKGFWG